MTERYIGVKFKVIHLPGETIDDPRVEELIKAGKELAAKGFCPENSGNLSFRRTEACLPDRQGFVITRAGSELGKLTPKDFVPVTDVDIEARKVLVAGKADPSSEAMMHFMIYAARPETTVILHAHALDLKNAATTKKAFPYGTPEFAHSAVEVLKDHDLAVLKGHGFVSIGKTVAEALLKIG